MTELLLLAAIAFATGFCTGWTLKFAKQLADRVDILNGQSVHSKPEFDRNPPTMIIEPEEMVELKAVSFPNVDMPYSRWIRQQELLGDKS